MKYLTFISLIFAQCEAINIRHPTYSVPVSTEYEPTPESLDVRGTEDLIYHGKNLVNHMIDASKKPANTKWVNWPTDLPPTTPLKIANRVYGDGDIVKFS